MGVIYKLKPEIKDYILQQKATTRTLSCRKISALIAEKFSVKISKSHINDILKGQGLSSRVGRTPKHKRRSVETESYGDQILRAADALLGGSAVISALLRAKMLNTKSFSVEEAIYQKTGLPVESTDLELPPDLSQEIVDKLKLLVKENLALKFKYADEASFIVDSQFRTFWSSAKNIPYIFSSTYYNITTYVKEKTLVLFTAPGYDLFPLDWLDFLIRCSMDKKITGVSLIGAKGEETQVVNYPQGESYGLIFGLWPWQYREYRQIQEQAEVRYYNFAPLKRDFYVSDATIKLSQHFTNQSVALRGIILRRQLDSKPEIFIATNIPKDKASNDAIIDAYLSRWPYLQDSYKDFSRQIELFTYNASTHELFPGDKLLASAGFGNLSNILSAYRECLDAYVRWYFLPLEYRQLDFSTTKSRFYTLKLRLKKKKDESAVIFTLPQGYAYFKDMEYLCQKINERNIRLSDGSRLWFGTG